MKCPNCNRDMPETSLFCTSCGTRLKEAEPKDTDAKNVKKIPIILILTIVVWAAVIALFAGFFVMKQINLQKAFTGYEKLVDEKNYKKALKYYEEHGADRDFSKKANVLTMSKYTKAIEDHDIELGTDLFNSGLLSQENKEIIENNVVSMAEESKQKFIDLKTDYVTVKELCSNYSDYKSRIILSKTNEVNEFCNLLNESRRAYERGVEAMEIKNYIKVLTNFKKVIEEDSNYQSAMDQYDEALKFYKEEVKDNLEEYIQSHDFDTAERMIKNLVQYCEEDDRDLLLLKEELYVARAQYENEQKKREIEEYKNNQQVEVISAKMTSGFNSKTGIGAQPIIRNNSDQIVKDVRIGLLLFDQDGKPVARENDTEDAEYINLAICEYTSCKLSPGKKYGSQYGFVAPNECKKIKGCVYRVEYEDGTTWVNPYFEYWVEENCDAY